VGVPIWGPRLRRFEGLVGSAREAVGDESFNARWAEGRQLGFDDALAAAGRVVHAPPA
jgi:hypothetical protein